MNGVTTLAEVEERTNFAVNIGNGDGTKTAPAPDLDRYPVTREGWGYLRSTGLSAAVRMQNWSRGAKAVGRQLTELEVKVVATFDVELVSADPVTAGEKFRGLKVMAFRHPNDTRPVGGPIEGLPDEIAVLIDRKADGSPKFLGSVATRRQDLGGGRLGDWEKIPLPGMPFWVCPDGKAVFNKKTALGLYLAEVGEETYTDAEADEKIARAREHHAANLAKSREKIQGERNAEEARKAFFKKPLTSTPHSAAPHVEFSDERGHRREPRQPRRNQPYRRRDNDSDDGE